MLILLRYKYVFFFGACHLESEFFQRNVNSWLFYPHYISNILFFFLDLQVAKEGKRRKTKILPSPRKIMVQTGPVFPSHPLLCSHFQAQSWSTMGWISKKQGKFFFSFSFEEKSVICRNGYFLIFFFFNFAK